MDNRMIGENPTECMAKDGVFALDIGTRSVIGVVGLQKGDNFHLLEIEKMEHPRRAMIDGQIEDIDQVAKIAEMVKKRLENRLDVSLTRVHIAAAGRALRTVRASFTQNFEGEVELLPPDIATLEALAIQAAREQLMEAMPAERSYENSDFYCVGHSVVQYTLDNYPLSTLVGHRGREATADIIATFLPKQVVDSLYSVMQKIGLSVGSLTLEPIAAMNAVIPRELRILNLALVDIGAGTSDIAISRDGSVVAYTMATTAGDEITEAIIKAHLVDFETAEWIKAQLQETEGIITFENILGLEQTMTAEELQSGIHGAIDDLCGEISRKILECNGEKPAAVFLVGGGSKLPRLADGVAANLDIEANKVAVGRNNYMKRFVITDQKIDDPEYVTPLGIAITAGMQKQYGITVNVNGVETPVVKNGSATVMDILLSCGYDNSRVMGRSGKSVTFEFNGVKRTVRGGYPTQAEITVNGVSAGITTSILDGDVIRIVPAVPGADAAPVVGDFVEGETFTVLVNGIEMDVGECVLLNGKQVLLKNQPIRDRDVMQVVTIGTVAELLQATCVDMADAVCQLNGKLTEGSEELKAEDVLQYATDKAGRNAILYQLEASGEGVAAGSMGMTREEATVESVNEAVEIAEPTSEKKVETFTPMVTDGTVAPVLSLGMSPVEEQQTKTIFITLNNRPMALPPKVDFSLYQFVDMLNFVDIDPTRPQGNIILTINHKSASYLDYIRNGDVVTIMWEK